MTWGMAMADLGVIERVDLREVWPHEAQDFTPWLAENLDKLGAALGLDLELQSSEAAVGPFSLDVLAHDADGNGPVVIENQLGATDHTHLGQLLTYAAGYDAYAVIWLTREFREEHRQVLDWLNHRTGEGTQFFGVVVEAWRIDGSRPAPHFKLVAMPNGWQKRLSAVEGQARARNNSEQERRYEAYWRALGEMMTERNYVIGGDELTNPWIWFESEFEGVTWNTSFQPRGRAFVELYLWAIDMGREWADQVFHRLEARKEDIESKLGYQLRWETFTRRRDYRISAECPGRINADDGTLAELREWMRDQLLAFDGVFAPIIQEIVDMDSQGSNAGDE